MVNKKVFVLAIVIALVFLVSCVPSAKTCDSAECFIDTANACQTSSFTSTEDIGTVQYESKDCVFTKTLVSAHPDENPEIKALLEGKSMTCSYEKGDFDDGLVTSSYLGIGACEGELATVISKLIIFS